MTIEIADPPHTIAAAHDPLDLPPPKVRRELRRLAGATQEDVAAQFGVSDGAVSYWERYGPGRRHKRRYLLLLIHWAEDARKLGLPIGWPTTPPGADQQK